MDKKFSKQIEDIICQLECPKGFKCVESGFKNLCKAKDRGLEDYLECLENNPSQCEFAIHFGSSYFCRCPLRVYILNNLENKLLSAKSEGSK